MPEDAQRKPKRSRDDAEDDLVLGTPDPRRKGRHAIKGIFPKHPQKKGRAQKDTHGGMVWEQFKEKLSPPHWMHPTNVLVALMRKGPLNNAALVAATHKGFGKVADGTSTRVMTCTTNKWRVKIDWKEVYNVRDPPRMRDCGKESRRREKKKKTVSICMVLKTIVT